MYFIYNYFKIFQNVKVRIYIKCNKFLPICIHIFCEIKQNFSIRDHKKCWCCNFPNFIWYLGRYFRPFIAISGMRIKDYVKMEIVAFSDYFSTQEWNHSNPEVFFNLVPILSNVVTISIKCFVFQGLKLIPLTRTFSKSDIWKSCSIY